MKLFRRKKDLHDAVLDAQIETQRARNRLAIAEALVAEPHKQIRATNHFAQDIVDLLVRGHNGDQR